MKVGILTFHAAHNFGSMLQAYALQKTVEKTGNICEIINMRPKEQKKLYDWKIEKESNLIKYLIKKIIFRKKKWQYEKFEEFLKKYLNITEEYNDRKQFENSKKEYDIYVSGSDQIWNTKTTDFDIAYFLGFKKEGKRIAYSVSAGSGKNIEIKKYEEYIRNYSFISVRERSLAKQLKDEFNINVELTLDPTLLLKKEEWDCLVNLKFESELPEHYIFFYSLGYGEEEEKILQYLKKKYNLPVVLPHRIYSAEGMKGYKVIDECGPEEFITLVKNSDMVFTTSFHGCIFSIIYHKKLIVYLPNEGHIDERKISMLEIAGMERCGIENLLDLKKYEKRNEEIDYDEVEKRLDKERQKSFQYLEKSLGVIQ